MLRSSLSQRSDLSLHSLKSKTVLENTNDNSNGALKTNHEVSEEAWADIVRYNTLQYQQEQEELKRKKEDQKLKVREELAK